MDRLISQVWNLYHDITDGIVRPSIPVLYFGNYERYQRSPLKVITVGKNPSSNEFPAFDPFHRFAKARGLYPAILQGEFYREYLDALNSPYSATWRGVRLGFLLSMEGAA